MATRDRRERRRFQPHIAVLEDRKLLDAGTGFLGLDVPLVDTTRLRSLILEESDPSRARDRDPERNSDWPWLRRPGQDRLQDVERLRELPQRPRFLLDLLGDRISRRPIDGPRFRPDIDVPDRRLEPERPIEPALPVNPNGSPSQPAVVLDVEYTATSTTDRDLALDIYSPRGPVPDGGWPVVLAIHGGGWNSGDKQFFGPRVAPLTRFGFQVIAVNYTLSEPGAPSWPQGFEDVVEAVGWIHTNAEQIGADPDRIAALGESAGGHLASMLGVLPEAGGSVQAVVSLYGPTDLVRLFDEASLARSPIAMLLGDEPQAVPDRADAASPITHVSPDDAPMLLIYGTEDELVPVSQGSAFSDALTRAGVAHDLQVFLGQPHGFALTPQEPNLIPSIVGFLQETMGSG